jgi:hypothetical protein
LSRQHFAAIMNAEPEFRRRINEKVAAIVGGDS